MLLVLGAQAMIRGLFIHDRLTKRRARPLLKRAPIPPALPANPVEISVCAIRTQAGRPTYFEDPRRFGVFHATTFY
jgi:hypothetical protein